MAINDPYATAVQYRAGIDQDDAAEDVEILEYLTAISRIIERRAGVMPSTLFRHFTLGSATEKILTGQGGKRMYIDDVGSVTGFIVEVDLDGDQLQEQALVRDTDFFLGPINVLLGSELLPYRWMEIIPTSILIGSWPKGSRTVGITAAWGWPAIPVAIEKGCIAITKAVRDATKQPFTLTLESIEDRIAMAPTASRLLDELIHRYKRGETYF